jgi:hypothetical protein
MKRVGGRPATLATRNYTAKTRPLTFRGALSGRVVWAEMLTKAMEKPRKAVRTMTAEVRLTVAWG